MVRGEWKGYELFIVLVEVKSPVNIEKVYRKKRLRITNLMYVVLFLITTIGHITIFKLQASCNLDVIIHCSRYGRRNSIADG